MLKAVAFVAFLLWNLVPCVAVAQSEAWQRATHEGLALYEAGRFADATRLFEQALRIAEEERDPHGPNLGTSLNNLAALYRARGRYAEAELLLRRALAIWEAALGSGHQDVALILNNLAGLYQV